MFKFPVHDFFADARRTPHRVFRGVFVSAVICAGLFASGPALADPTDSAPSGIEATYKDIEQTIGNMPSFLRRFPKAALPGAWAEVKALQFSNDTALPPKVKALISLAVSAQIPCRYCIWEDTESAKRAGATEDEINEAIVIAAVSRHWSTVFNGMQLDFETFKKELGGDAPSQ